MNHPTITVINLVTSVSTTSSSSLSISDDIIWPICIGLSIILTPHIPHVHSHRSRGKDTQYRIHNDHKKLLNRRHTQPDGLIPRHQVKLRIVAKIADQTVQQPHSNQRQSKHDAQENSRLAALHAPKVAQSDYPEADGGQVDEQEENDGYADLGLASGVLRRIGRLFVGAAAYRQDQGYDGWQVQELDGAASAGGGCCALGVDSCPVGEKL